MSNFNLCEHCKNCELVCKQDGWQYIPTELYTCTRQMSRRQCNGVDQYEPILLSRIDRRHDIVYTLHEILQRLNRIANVLLIDRLTEREREVLQEVSALC